MESTHGRSRHQEQSIRMSPNINGWLSRLPFFRDQIYHLPPHPADGRRALVLDLDETLVHTCGFCPNFLTDSTELGDGTYLLLRPGLRSFLEYATENFEIFIYTFAERGYAAPIIQIIAPRLDMGHLLFRDSCCLRDNRIYKDLAMLGRDMKDVILIEDNPMTARFFSKNTLLIPRWTGSPTDTALTTMVPEILERCRRAGSVQDVLADRRIPFLLTSCSNNAVSHV